MEVVCEFGVVDLVVAGVPDIGVVVVVPEPEAVVEELASVALDVVDGEAAVIWVVPVDVLVVVAVAVLVVVADAAVVLVEVVGWSEFPMMVLPGVFFALVTSSVLLKH